LIQAKDARMRFTLLLLSLVLAPAIAAGDAPSPIGIWKTIDDESGKAEALVKIVESNGELRGSIARLFQAPNEDQNPHCEKCAGERKNAPILGMTILYGLHRGDDGSWTGGEILDPNNGNTYHATVVVAPDNRTLSLRGYIGVPLFGRSQTWIRVE